MVIVGIRFEVILGEESLRTASRHPDIIQKNACSGSGVSEVLRGWSWWCGFFHCLMMMTSESDI
jgi:hypothetical protein